MCSNSTLAEINHQAQDKLHISLKQRFLDPIELLTRYKSFHCNCEALLQSEKNISESNHKIYEIHHTRAREFTEVLQILEGDMDNG